MGDLTAKIFVAANLVRGLQLTTFGSPVRMNDFLHEFPASRLASQDGFLLAFSCIDIQPALAENPKANCICFDAHSGPGGIIDRE